ncbi:type VII secretion target [Mycolicibacterium sp. XJ1819]
MPGDDLRVTTVHLGQLAAQHASAAAETRAATHAVDGVDAALRITHGAIAAAATGAVEAVLAARRSAGTRMAAISDGLSEKLTDAATRYDRIDDAMGGALDIQMRTE